ncbi:MAG TPA: NAD(P)-dependent oxidoreductase [bacterium]|nr:NAD(P)-dependent oxidoreductase [bacterium]
MKEVLVTGATGFVGGHLTELLLAKGIRPRLLTRRRNDDVSRFEKEGASIYVGEQGDTALLREATDGCDTVIHVAGATKRLIEQEYLDGNLRFTEALLAPLTGGQRFILVSSQAAAGPSTGDRPVVESDPPRPLTWYGKSKLAAEEAVRKWGAEHGDKYLILRPCSVFGPNERDIYTYFQFMDKGILLLLGTGGKKISIIHVADLCDAIVAAAESTVTGRTFFVANDVPVSWRELGETIRVAMGKKNVLRIAIPEWVAAPIGHAAGLAGRLMGRALPVNGQKVIEMKQDAWICSNGAIKEALDWRPRLPLAEAVAQTVAWYRANGWLKQL